MRLIKLREQLEQELIFAGGLRKESNTEDLLSRLEMIMNEEADPKEMIRFYIGKYIKSFEYSADEAEIEIIFAGVLAFIWVNWWGESYEPLFLLPTKESKKWWQFWKK